jgi:hypothetical protein
MGEYREHLCISLYVASIIGSDFKLFTWLDVSNRLLTVYSPPLTGPEIVGMISAGAMILGVRVLLRVYT